LLIKCSYSDGKDTKVFQERAKLFGTKKVETIIGLQIQGPHAIKKCLAVRSTNKYKKQFSLGLRGEGVWPWVYHRYQSGLLAVGISPIVE